MVLEDIKIGMKVIPIRKSVGVAISSSVARHLSPERPYLFVVNLFNFDGRTIIQCSPNKGSNLGDHFLAKDLNLYTVETTKRSKLTIASLRG